MGVKSVKSYMALFAGAILTACSSAPAVDPAPIPRLTPLAGYWSEADARQIAQAMTSRALNDPWLEQFEDLHGGKQPAVMVGRVRNLSPEHISLSAFITALQQALIDSGKVRFIPTTAHADIEQPVTSNTSSTIGAGSSDESSDFMVQASIDTTMDEAAETETKWYQVDMRLVDLHDNVIVWVGQQKIKKTAGAEDAGLHP